MAPQKNTGFDAFFNAVTRSPEFRALMNDDQKNNAKISDDTLEDTLESMHEGVARASSLMQEFEKHFGTNEAIESGERFVPDAQTFPPKTGNPTDEAASSVQVEHFVQKPGKPWGFEAVAGMSDLKRELTESFIKPIKFKFFIEKLRKESENQNPEIIEKSEKKNEKKDENKEKMLLKLFETYEKFQISIPTGMLFYGPPGTGKTFITKKLAEELNCGFISKNMGEFGSSYLHQTTKNIKDFFTGAKKAAENEPIILFLDEIDSLVSARTDHVDSNKAEEISQFLQEFNALEDAPNLIVIAATNRPDHLDPALLRSGRLDKKIYIGAPDDIAREELFRMYIEKSGRPHEALDYAELALLTYGYVSADIEMISDEVARDASRPLLELIDRAQDGELTEEHIQDHKITMQMLRDTIAETPSSLKMVDMSVYERWQEKISI